MVTAADPFGNPLTLQLESSATAMAGFVEGFLGYEPRILEVLGAAEHDDSLIVQTCAAVLWLFSESPAVCRRRANTLHAPTARRCRPLRASSNSPPRFHTGWMAE